MAESRQLITLLHGADGRGNFERLFCWSAEEMRVAVNKSDPIHDFSVMPLRDDNPSRVDLLGFDDIVVAIESTITREELQPITVGVNAPWGGGKTTVLRLLEEKLEAREDVIVVYVSPWEYDRSTDAKASLIGAVLERLEGQARGDQNVLDAAARRLNPNPRRDERRGVVKG